MIPRLTLLLSCGVAIAEPGSASPAGSDLPKGQRGAPAEWVVDPQQSELHYEIQRAPKGELALTPNEAFFPKLGLEATGAGAFPDDPKWNKGESFSEIGKWDRGDAAEWGLWFEKAGVLTVDLDSSSQLADASRISFGEEVIDARGQARLAVKRPGLHVLRFECTGDPGAAAVFRSIRIQVSAEAAAGAGVVRKRWRPAAAHARFRSDRANGSKTRLWIMEMDAVPGSLDFYAPITTPFGYYGPTWNADGTVGSSFNFSLWSYGRGKEAPPLDKLSHLLAIGHRDATFGGYGHEGTGVKIRDWKPLEGRSGQRQVFALRLEPGGPGSTHDTYCSYFYAADEKRWRLYGVGRSNRGGRARSVESLTLGSFVEVPGRASTQRTGVYERRMRYRGWLVDTEGTLSPIDRMSTGDVDRETGLTYTDRGITEDGWFTLATGGWGWRRPLPEKEVVLPAEISHAAPYLGAEDLRFLHRVPSSIEPTRVIREQGETSVEFEVRGLGGHAEAVVFWGERDGLSFVDAWENQAPVPQLREGKNQLILPGAAGDDALFVRLLLQSDQGQFWSMESRSP